MLSRYRMTSIVLYLFFFSRWKHSHSQFFCFYVVWSQYSINVALSSPSLQNQEEWNQPPGLGPFIPSVRHTWWRKESKFVPVTSPLHTHVTYIQTQNKEISKTIKQILIVYCYFKFVETCNVIMMTMMCPH